MWFSDYDTDTEEHHSSSSDDEDVREATDNFLTQEKTDRDWYRLEEWREAQSREFPLMRQVRTSDLLWSLHGSVEETQEERFTHLTHTQTPQDPLEAMAMHMCKDDFPYPFVRRLAQVLAHTESRYLAHTYTH